MNSVQHFSGVGDQKPLCCHGSLRRDHCDTLSLWLANGVRGLLTARFVRLDVSGPTPVHGMHVRRTQASERLLLSNPVPGQPREMTVQVILNDRPTRRSNRIETLYTYERDAGFPQQWRLNA